MGKKNKEKIIYRSFFSPFVLFFCWQKNVHHFRQFQRESGLPSQMVMFHQHWFIHVEPTEAIVWFRHHRVDKRSPSCFLPVQVPQRSGRVGRASRAGGEGDDHQDDLHRGGLPSPLMQRRDVDHGAGGRHAALRRLRFPPLLPGLSARQEPDPLVPGERYNDVAPGSVCVRPTTPSIDCLVKCNRWGKSN